MNKLLAILLAGFVATGSFAAAHMGAPMSGAKSATQPEAMKSGSEKAQANAEMKKAKKAKTGKKNSTDAQMKKDAAKL